MMGFADDVRREFLDNLWTLLSINSTNVTLRTLHFCIYSDPSLIPSSPPSRCVRLQLPGVDLYAVEHGGMFHQLEMQGVPISVWSDSRKRVGARTSVFRSARASPGRYRRVAT